MVIKTKMDTTKDIDEYIKNAPESVRARLEEIRQVIKSTVPEAQEKIGYGIPTFTYFGNLVHFAAFKKHIGFYPAPSGIEAFEKELSKYRAGKGTIQFPLDKPLPISLIKKVVKFRVKENKARAKKK